MFHWVTGMPFDSELHGGAYDDLTLWEQIDDGAQYTPAKKWLLSVPILLCVFHSLLRHDFVLMDTKIPRIDTLHELQPMAICCQLNSTDPISDNSEATTGAVHIFYHCILVFNSSSFSCIANGSVSWPKDQVFQRPLHPYLPVFPRPTQQ
jgi:hypothetical protein